ncbi:MAG: dihydropteroate synthase [Nitrososphaerota archaeon]|jgi:dihydropteroate synthase|nr:dihydropteroate synthase [Nitrososphaerota archaeon]MDG6927226.1 dihydropteroate synthase [Nitrososphaerota archaeon]MDG6929716.1 dihydropteroate synthase [Nitrososphaerota archaeon]MDG6932669.1 dihydropteroate synthase [Nitrososphaerota archaeon]MDG6936127.1 dihydropteroate synthase [Nitrososphaerota archaeon]
MSVSYLGNVKVGLGETVKLIAAINLSPESFFVGSVVTKGEELEKKVLSSISEGASIIDLGGMSTAPYRKTFVSESVELDRILWALDAIKNLNIKSEISIDTQRNKIMEESLKKGASIINDISGLSDRRAAKIIKDYGASLILCAAGNAHGVSDPGGFVVNAINNSLNNALNAGIEPNKIIIDPAIGFFRNSLLPSHDWDAVVIANIEKIKRRVGFPMLVGVSRKSFIGFITKDEDPSKRLAGSLAAAAISVINGVDAIRTHDVAETAKAVKVAEYIRSKT